MAAKKSAGLLLFRHKQNALEVFIVHPGGPFWKNKDAGAWSIPKGELDENEDPLQAAVREFCEETGSEIAGKFIALNPVKLKSGKLILAWAVEGDIDAGKISSNHINIEWPPRSGKQISIPEVDIAMWCSLEEAALKLNEKQVAFLDELRTLVK